jgi:hypothetical protein
VRGAQSILSRPRKDQNFVITLTSFLLLWFAGLGLRLTILAVPPVIPLIHDELHLSATQVGRSAVDAVRLRRGPGSLLIAWARLSWHRASLCSAGRAQRAADRGERKADHQGSAHAEERRKQRRTGKVYCGPVLRHPAELIQAANDRSAVAV